jgi:pyrimidine-nucleoside phosphorylase
MWSILVAERSERTPDHSTSLAMNAVNLIIKKRDHQRLSADEIQDLIDAYVRGDVADYQMSAFLMAGFLNGLDDEETFALTRSMLESGIVLDLGEIPGLKVDKHSTGGVGDKISLILAPVVVACGVPVPMISGRGLGHTGGTLDKLESIPGFDVRLSIDQYRQQLADIGIVMIGQTSEIAPADRELYGLRDVTGTVEFIPYIASSIMSKKLAEGIDALVLDVKVGRGAFMKNEADARKLAETLTEIGTRFDKRVSALLTDMSRPLGYAVGNWPETLESIRILKGERTPDVFELTIALAGEMIWLGGKAGTPGEGRSMAEAAVDDGTALEVFRTMVERQSGDVSIIDDPSKRADSSRDHEIEARPDQAGFVKAIDALAIGQLAVDLGAGRHRKADEVDPLAGITFAVRPGDRLEPGQPLATIHTARRNRMDEFSQRLLDAIEVSDTQPELPPLIIDRYFDRQWTGVDAA